MTATATMTPGPQHLRALERANHVRLARAELKRQVAAGGVTAAEVVACPPWEAESMTLAELLCSQRRWGHTRCRKFLAAVPLSETKTVGSLTERQRVALADALHLVAAPASAPARTSAGVLSLA